MTSRITKAGILRTAVDLLDRGGIPALAMRRIAAELGVQQSALYWHFTSKQELLASLADQLLREVAPPQAHSWQARVTERSFSLRDVLTRHPDGAELVSSAFALGLSSRAPLREVSTDLERAGLRPTDADAAASVLVHFVLSYTINEQQHRQAVELGAIDAEESAADDPERRLRLDRFGAGVRLIVSGIEAQWTAGQPTS